MQLHIHAKGLDLSEATKVYTTEKFSRLEKYLSHHQSEAAVIDVSLIVEPNHTEVSKDKCHATISGLGKGHTFHVETEEPDMHVAIDAAVQKLEEQLRREKDKHRDHLNKEATEAKYIPPETTMETEPVQPGLVGEAEERAEEGAPPADDSPGDR